MFPAAVMRFMGDAPLKGQSELDVLCTLLKVSPAPTGAPLPAHLSAGAAAFGVGTMWPNEECIPLVGRVLGRGRQVCLQEPTVFLWACDL